MKLVGGRFSVWFPFGLIWLVNCFLMSFLGPEKKKLANLCLPSIFFLLYSCLISESLRTIDLEPTGRIVEFFLLNLLILSQMLQLPEISFLRIFY